jgi:hypothetical protein
MAHCIINFRARSAIVLAFLLLAACRAKNRQDLSAAQLTAVVAREQASLAPCYQSALDKMPYEHEFRIETTLQIRPDGRVSEVTLDQPGIEGVGPCIEAAIRTWQFPKAVAATRASLPIVFTPNVEKTLPNLPPGFQVLQNPQ